MPDGVVVSTEEGVPQGGPLSPLLSNIALDELDREFARRGYHFVRYADDANIYVRSERAWRGSPHPGLPRLLSFLRPRVDVGLGRGRGVLGLTFRLELFDGVGERVRQRLVKRRFVRPLGLQPRIHLRHLLR